MGGEWNKKYEVNKFGKRVVHSIFTPLKTKKHIQLLLTTDYNRTTTTSGGI